MYVYIYIYQQIEISELCEHSPVPNTAGAHMQQRNAQCCTPLCLGWMDWHRSVEGTPDTCEQFMSLTHSI